MRLNPPQSVAVLSIIVFSVFGFLYDQNPKYLTKSKKVEKTVQALVKT